MVSILKEPDAGGGDTMLTHFGVLMIWYVLLKSVS